MTKIKISIKKQIKEIIRQFDFNKVNDVMTALNWQWTSTKGVVPSIKELKKRSKGLLYSVAEHKRRTGKCGVIGTGGFFVEIDNDNCLSLRFEVTSWCGYDSWDEKAIFKPYEEKLNEPT